MFTQSRFIKSLQAFVVGALITLSVPAAANCNVVKSAAPVHQCINITAETLKELEQGTQQLVVSVNAFKPPKAGSTAFVVRHISADGSKHELSRFAIFPNRSFTAKQRARSQHFRVALSAEVINMLKNEGEACIEVSFTTPAKGARAEIDIALAGS